MTTASRVLIDCDGPLADFVGALCGALRRRGFFRRFETSIRHWDLSLSLSHDEAAEVDTILRVPGFWSSMPRMPYAVELVQAIRRAGAEPFCVTSPYPTPRFFVERPHWLAPMFTPDETLFVRTGSKRLVDGEVLIEDHPGTAASWLDAHPKGNAILVDRPWNTIAAREFVSHPRMWRTTDARLLETVEAFL